MENTLYVLVLCMNGVKNLQMSTDMHDEEDCRRKSITTDDFTFNNQKIMVIPFWDQKSIWLMKFMQPETTINAAVYYETLKKSQRATVNKKREMLTSGVVLIHDNIRPYRYGTTQQLLEQFQLDIIDHRPYSPKTEEMAKIAALQN